jgi:hypothetical protein
LVGGHLVRQADRPDGEGEPPFASGFLGVRKSWVDGRAVGGRWAAFASHAHSNRGRSGGPTPVSVPGSMCDRRALPRVGRPR